jgi:hypothetical protein
MFFHPILEPGVAQAAPDCPLEKMISPTAETKEAAPCQPERPRKVFSEDSRKALRYLTTDALNAATAEALAARYGLDFEVIEPRDLQRPECKTNNLLVDWDFVPQDYQEKLLNGRIADIVGIHGYHVAESDVSVLSCRGIIFSSRLDHHLLEALAARDA